MPRAKGKTNEYMHIQADMDDITSALIGWEIAERFIRIRIEQARQRTGMDELLVPALDELDIMSAQVRAAKSHVSKTLARLME
jgi:hypothetical protein